MSKVIAKDNPEMLKSVLEVCTDTLQLMMHKGDLEFNDLLLQALDKNALQAADVILDMFSSEPASVEGKLFDHLYRSRNLHGALHMQKRAAADSCEELIDRWADQMIQDYLMERQDKDALPLGLQRELIAVYLRSDFEDFSALVSKLIEKMAASHDPIQSFVDDLLIVGTQVAKDRAFPVAKNLSHVYGELEPDHYLHQFCFGTASFRQVMFLSELAKTSGQLSLEALVTYFAFWRGDLAHQVKSLSYMQFYSAKTRGCDTSFSSNPRYEPDRYVIYESNFNQTIKRHLESTGDSFSPYLKIQRDYDGHPTVSLRVLGLVTDIQWNAFDSMSYLEPVHQRICSLDTSQMNAIEFHREVMGAYFDLMSANFLGRGSAHIMQMVTAYWYAAHGYAPPQMPFELGFMDCQVLSLSSKEQFLEICMDSFGKQPLRPLSVDPLGRFSPTAKEYERLQRSRKIGLLDQGHAYHPLYEKKVTGKT